MTEDETEHKAEDKERGEMYQTVISAVFLMICTYADIRSKKIYKSVITVYLLFSLAGHFIAAFGSRSVSVSEMAAGLIPGAVCIAISFLTRQGIGYGDSVLITVCGISVGGRECLSIILCAFFWAGIWGLVMWRFFHMDKKKEIPFVPFLLLGFVIQNAGEVLGI